MEDFLDYVWVSDVGDDAHGATTQWTYGNINIKDSFESLRPSHLQLRIPRSIYVHFDRVLLWFFNFVGNDEFS